MESLHAHPSDKATNYQEDGEIFLPRVSVLNEDSLALFNPRCKSSLTIVGIQTSTFFLNSAKYGGRTKWRLINKVKIGY